MRVILRFKRLVVVSVEEGDGVPSFVLAHAEENRGDQESNDDDGDGDDNDCDGYIAIVNHVQLDLTGRELFNGFLVLDAP